MSVPLKIRTRTEYLVMLAEVERLVKLDPKRDTRQGKRLVRLAAAVETYEKKHFPIGKP